MTVPICKIIQGDCVEVLKTLPAESIQMAVTSPPYFGLRQYHGGDAEIGCEKTPEEYIVKIVAVMAEVWRILRSDGLLWLNLGDSFANDGKWGGHTGGKHVKVLHNSPIGRNKRYTGFKPKTLMMIPARVAIALCVAGWILRNDIIWNKLSVMPESVTDRCTKSHEHIFMLAKQPKYFFDAEAIKEPSNYPDDDRHERCYDGHKSNPTGMQNGLRPPSSKNKSGFGTGAITTDHLQREKRISLNYLDSGRKAYPMRNKRDVWSVSTANFDGGHFATFPPDLIKPCILAGTSASGCCPKCGSPHERQTESSKTFQSGSGKSGNGISGKQDLAAADTNSTPDIRLGPVISTRTTGWNATCQCGRQDTIPCTVLDPLFGSGTTGKVSLELGRNCIGIELNPDYCELARQRTSVTPGLPI